MTSLLTVTGATGTQGQAVINYFLEHEPEYRLRGLTRNTSSAKAQELSKRGVEMVRAEYGDPDSLKKAFADSDAIYAYTDFSSLVETAAAQAILDAGHADSLAHAARAIAIQQGKNVADAAASVPGLKRLVWSTTADTDKLSGGKYAGAYELENKAVVLRYIRSLPELKDKVNAIAPSIFLNAIINFPWFFGWTKLAPEEYVFRTPIDPHAKLPWFDIDNEAGRFTAALLRQPAGTDVDATTMRFSIAELASLLERKYGVSVRAERVSVAQYVGDDTTGYSLNGYHMLAFLEEYDALGDDPSYLHPDKLVPPHPDRRTLEDIDWAATLFEA